MAGMANLSDGKSGRDSCRSCNLDEGTDAEKSDNLGSSEAYDSLSCWDAMIAAMAPKRCAPMAIAL